MKELEEREREREREKRREQGKQSKTEQVTGVNVTLGDNCRGKADSGFGLIKVERGELLLTQDC